VRALSSTFVSRAILATRNSGMKLQICRRRFSLMALERLVFIHPCRVAGLNKLFQHFFQKSCGMRVNKLYDMKANQLALLLLFLMLGAAAAQQTNSFVQRHKQRDVWRIESQRRKRRRGSTVQLGPLLLQRSRSCQNYSEAVNWYRKSAEQGDGKAQCNLGVCYLSGTGVTKDAAEAVKWLRKAAEQGIAAAENGLGGCYGEGEGVLKDYVEADKWFNLASAQGYELAKTNLLEVEKSMTAEQIAEAQQLAREFTPHKDSNSSSFHFTRRSHCQRNRIFYHG